MDFLKRHHCDKCDKKFKKVEELMQHQQVFHGKDLLYECKECNVGFTGMEQMRDHAKKFHSYNKMKEQERNGGQGQKNKSDGGGPAI